jgi:hypothetical protein
MNAILAGKIRPDLGCHFGVIVKVVKRETIDMGRRENNQ